MKSQCEYMCELMQMFPLMKACICRTQGEDLMPKEICIEMAIRNG